MKVIIVEDRPLIRRAIVETIDWTALNCELVASAGDGLAAKLMIEQHRPDIIITDIRMPEMDGLQLAEYAIQYLGSAKVIVITGYQDFHYAKQCVRLGVMEYLLKPLNNAELEAVVSKAVMELMEERQNRQEKERLLIAAKRQAISELLFGQKDLPLNGTDFHSTNLSAYRFGLIIIKDTYTSEIEVAAEKAAPKQEVLAACDHILLALENQDINESFQFYQSDEIVYVYLFPQKISKQSIMKTLNDRLRQVKQVMDQWSVKGYPLKGSFPIHSIEQLKEQYEAVSGQLSRHFFNLHNHSERNDVKLSILHELEQFHIYLTTDTTSEMYARIEFYLTSISTYAAGNVTVAKALVYELCLTIAKQYYKKSNNERIKNQSVDEMLSYVNALNDMAQAASYVRSLLDVFVEQQTTDAASYGSLIKAVLHYIDENYRHDISLNTVAEHFHISSGHLSRLFRKEVGASFVDMVTRTRIQAAKQLLRDPTKRIAEIGDLTGFNNYIYFYQVFKKYEHISPQEYRNKL
ncbi:response regulator [Paenibacillus sp. strain BS8-2]